jgi:Highly conserved protein containing a thioredoxin domain
VDWYPWGDEAFDIAKAEDKPVFLSIGYSTCHWYHVRKQYVYFGDTNCRDIVDTDEGKLYWVDKSHLFDRQLSVTSKVSLEHYLSNNQSNGIMVGTVFAVNSIPQINWCPVQDWEGI